MPLKSIVFLLTFFVTFSQFATASGATWYVNRSVYPSGDGQSPETAFTLIQEAIDAASDGDTVIAAPECYVNIKFKGKNITVRSSDPLDRAVVRNTIIHDWESGPVVTFSGTESETCILAGFTITCGKNNRAGGGICGTEGKNHTHAAIRHNVITVNSAWSGGGIAYCDGLMQNNTISNNSGGGLHACDGIIEANTVSSNTGSGLSYCHGVVRRNAITENTYCGLLYCNGVIEDNVVSYNDGAGLESCDGTIQANVVCGNAGGGLCYCDGVIQNNLILKNPASWGGCGLANCNGMTLNNTICGNSGYGLYKCKGVIRNCIIWGNTGNQIYESSSPSFSCIQDWTGDGAGNMVDDPLFVNAGEGDYHLQGRSACIGRGVNYYWLAWPQRDLDGNCRLAGERVDMGCYEYNSPLDSDGDLLCDEDEGKVGADSLDNDSDDDGLRDGLEILRGSDPRRLTAPGVFHIPSQVPTVQAGLCLAVKGDEVVVAPGTYTENLEFGGVDVTLRSSEPDNADVVAATVLDGAGSGPVVWFTGSETEACVLAGFTIRKGSALRGGGIRGGTSTKRSRAAILSNVVTGNLADEAVGGMAYCDGLIRGNTIVGNCSHGTCGRLVNCGGGGLAYCEGLIEGNTVAGNRANEYGGGLAYCHGLIGNNEVRANSAEWGGGLYGCGGTIQSNRIEGNSAVYGGGLAGCTGAIRNNVIAGNRAEGAGCGGPAGAGAFYCPGTFQNNTIVLNWSARFGGGLARCAGSVVNCIIWGNTAPNHPQVYEATSPTHSCIEGWLGGGEGNIAKYPRFFDTYGPDRNPETYEDNDYHLLSGSP